MLVLGKDGFDMPSRKALLRDSMNQRWYELSSKERMTTSMMATTRLRDYLRQIDAKNVLFYASMDDEPFVDGLIDGWLHSPEHKLILTRPCIRTKQMDPRLVSSWDDIQLGRLGIRIPKTTCPEFDLSKLDAVVVPGRAFDRNCNRLGRGYGFYDRFLSVLPNETYRIGFAFEFQICKQLPVEDHDVAMHAVVTEKEIILCP